MNPIDIKIDELRGHTSEFPYIEYYSHTNENMYKIRNEFTSLREDTLVLCSVSEGFEKALDLAITAILKRKHAYIN